MSSATVPISIAFRNRIESDSYEGRTEYLSTLETDLRFCVAWAFSARIFRRHFLSDGVYRSLRGRTQLAWRLLLGLWFWSSWRCLLVGRHAAWGWWPELGGYQYFCRRLKADFLLQWMSRVPFLCRLGWIRPASLTNCSLRPLSRPLRQAFTRQLTHCSGSQAKLGQPSARRGTVKR